MKKIRVLGTVVTVLAILIVGCGSPKKEDENQKALPANIIVLLDLSDRVSVEKYGEPAEEQVNDDKDNSQIILRVFDDIVKKENYDKSQSELRFFVPDQQGFPIDSERKKKLRVFGESPIGNVSKFDEWKESLIQTRDGLYDEVLTAPEANFTGADIWSWFKEEAKRYLKPEFRNYIICLSDGYLDFDENIQRHREKGTYLTIDKDLRESDDWKKKVHDEYKLKTPPKVSFRFPVKFLMLGIKDRTPEGSLRDRDILIAYWEPWLKSMGIEPFGFYSSDVEQEEIAGFLEAGQ